MKWILLPALMMIATTSFAETTKYLAKSPDHRTPLLELYTSEGCSSCPPADRFLSGLKRSDITSEQLVPLAFHVTYWDYIGWQDRFGDPRYDRRQRKIAEYGDASTIYTPQFVFDGADFRNYSNFSNHVRRELLKSSVVDLELAAEVSRMAVRVTLTTDSADSGVDGVHYYLTIYENDLSSDVDEGENEGETLRHDFVVRDIYGPFIEEETGSRFAQAVVLRSDWKRDDLGLVAIAQNPTTGEVLQALQLRLGE